MRNSGRVSGRLITNVDIEWGETMLGTILVVLLILALIGAFPRWPYSSGWGYGPSGLVGVLLIVVIILALSGHV
jgi:hypothetical protein